MRDNGYVAKGWGHELIWASTDKYCGKILHFEQGAKFSMHFHATKEETWFVLRGTFIVRCLDTTDASVKEHILKPGNTWHNKPLAPHQLICIVEGDIIEVSTPDSIEDNYRVFPGDSQLDERKV